MGEVTLLNTGLPTAITGALALLMPHLFVGRDERSHARIALRILLISGVLLLVSAALMALSYTQYEIALAGSLAEQPLATTLYFLKRGALMAMVWLPLLLLAWFGLAQRVERLRDHDIIRGSAR